MPTFCGGLTAFLSFLVISAHAEVDCTNEIEAIKEGLGVCLGTLTIGAFLVLNLIILLVSCSCAHRMGKANGVMSAVQRCRPKQAFDCHPPIFMLPKVDEEGGNGVEEVSFGLVGDDLEVSVVFTDEDRPSKTEDFLYDIIRKPLFGRSKDIETFKLIKGKQGYEKIEFSGTYAGEQTWKAKMPEHGTATLDINEFETRDGRLVIYVNVWNHLMSHKNNNTDMELVCEDSYRSSRGTRNEVDRRYAGIISKVA